MNGSASVPNTAVMVVPANPWRLKITFVNNDANNTIWLGQNYASITSGIPLYPKGVASDSRDNQGYIYKGAWMAISDVAGPSTLTYIEESVAPH